MNTPWYLDRKNWIKTLSGECCSVTELMGMKEEDGSWTYAIVVTSRGIKSVKVVFNQNNIVQ